MNKVRQIFEAFLVRVKAIYTAILSYFMSIPE